MLMHKWDETKKIIKEFKINQTLLAKELGIKISFFSEKMNEGRSNKFSDEQKEKIVSFLKNMSLQINKL